MEHKNRRERKRYRNEWKERNEEIETQEPRNKQLNIRPADRAKKHRYIRQGKK